MINKDTFAVFQIQKKALARLEAGAKAYGVFDPTTDTRDLGEDIEEELLDVMNYAAMLILKVRTLRHLLPQS